MNFLQLVQAVKREGGISGSIPTTTVGQVEELARVAQWVNFAWQDIQTMHAEWEFLRNQFQFTTTASKQSYAFSDTFDAVTGLPNTSNTLGAWKRDSFRKYPVANGVSSEMIMPYMEYSQFRDMYLFGAKRITTAPPVIFTIDPQKKIVLGDNPDGQYVVNGEYFAGPTNMAADTDTPTMPPQYHMAIVWKALLHYGLYEAASESIQRAQQEYPTWIARLTADQLPKITFGAPLA